ncbi:MAG: hypothetical protein QW112_02370 [Candidatus Micrarchaeia archaeon]
MERRKYHGGVVGWIDRANPWSAYNKELELKNQRKKELNEFIAGFRTKGPINDMIAGIMEKKTDEYADCSLDEVKKFIAMAETMKDPILITELVRAGPDLIKACIDEWQYDNIKSIAKDLIEMDLRTAIAFIKKSIELISSDRNLDVKGWAKKGMEIEDPLEKFQYFRGSSKMSQDVLGLGKRRVVELSQVLGSLKCFSRIIAAKPINIEPTSMAPYTDGTTIFLPPREEEFPTKELNRRKLRALTLHEARHAKESFYVDMSKIDIAALSEVIIKDKNNKRQACAESCGQEGNT